MIEAVIFDMDGVIIDSEPIHAESDRMTLEYFEAEISEKEFFKYIGMANPEMWADLKARFNLTASVEELLEKQFYYKKYLFGNRKLEPIDGIRNLLDKLQKNRIKIALASSSSRAFIELILSSLDIKEYFQVIVSGEEVSHSKPAPDIFLKAAELSKVDTSNCLVLEDSGYGVRAAKAAQMKCVGFINPNSGKQDLSLADAVVYSIEEVDYSVF